MIDNKYNNVNATNEEVEEFLSQTNQPVEFDQTAEAEEAPVMAVALEEEVLEETMPVEEAVEEVAVEESVEEEKDYIEGVPYQPAPLDFEDEEELIETVEEAPVVAPAFPANKNKLGDDFIDTLTEEERKDFADIFFLKSQGVMEGVPDYKPGEDNSLFFRKVFLYLGKYRVLIPDGLLSKMYDFFSNN